MNSVFTSIRQSMRALARDESGAQVIEYALIIAVVAVAFVLALNSLTKTGFSDLITRITTCLSTTCS